MTDITPELWDTLRAKAREASQRAYVPYSKYKVGVAALTDTGNIVTGANVENASYGLTLCIALAHTVRLVATIREETSTRRAIRTHGAP